MSATLCSVCAGKRLRPESLAVLVAGTAINEWLDDEGNPKFGKDEEQKKQREDSKDESQEDAEGESQEHAEQEHAEKA